MHNAALKGHANAFEALVRLGDPPDSKDNDGGTPMHYAATGGHAAAIRVLAKLGASAPTPTTRRHCKQLRALETPRLQRHCRIWEHKDPFNDLSATT